MSPARQLHLGSEAAQARVLAVMNLVGATGCAFAGWITPYPGAPHWAYRILAVMAGVAGVLLLTFAERVRAWVLQVLLASYSLHLGVLTVLSTRAVTVVGIGPPVIVAGMYAGYFLSRRALGWQLSLSLVSFMVGAVLSGTHPPALAIGVAVIASVGSALVLHHLTLTLRRQAGIDLLTGAATRTRWSEMAHREFTARPTGGQWVVIIDLDDFKTINDTEGHAAGDQVLTELSAAWRAALDPSALLGRLGGDEFVVLFPAPAAGAEATLDRLRAAHPARWSYGAAERRPGETLTAVLSRADDELRVRKNSRPADRRLSR